MPNTPRWSHPYPALTDAPNIPAHLQALATSLDGVAMDDQGELDARPPSTFATPGKKGRYYYATDTGQLFRDTGTSWVQVGGELPVRSTLPEDGSVPQGHSIDYLVDYDPWVPSVVWRMRYFETAGFGTWRPVGGAAPMRDDVATPAVGASTSGTMVDSRIFIPEHGSYILTFWSTIAHPSLVLTPYIGALGTWPDPAPLVPASGSGSANDFFVADKGSRLRLRLDNPSGTIAPASRVVMEVRPIDMSNVSQLP